MTDDYVARNTVAAVRVSEKRFDDVLAEFPSITGDLDLKTPCKHRFERHIPTTGRPCFAGARNVAPKHAALARQKIKDMLTSGVLERASGPYASPMHIVPKDRAKTSESWEIFEHWTNLLWKIHTKYYAFSSFKTRWKMQKFFLLLISNLGFTKNPPPRRTGRKQLSARLEVVLITPAAASAYLTVLKACNAWLIGWSLTLTTYKGTSMISSFSQQRRKNTNHIFANSFKSSMMLVLKSIPKRPS